MLNNNLWGLLVFIIITINLSLFCSFISILSCLVVAVVCCFHASFGQSGDSTTITLIFILTLDWQAWTVIPESQQAHQLMVFKVQMFSTWQGFQHFRGGPNTSLKLGPGTNYYRSPTTRRQVTCNTETRGPSWLPAAQTLLALGIVEYACQFREANSHRPLECH